MPLAPQLLSKRVRFASSSCQSSFLKYITAMHTNLILETKASLVLLVKWTLISGLIALLAGSASALFLFALEWATQTRLRNPVLIYGLPIAGFSVAWLYLYLGKNSEAGNNLVISEIHQPTQYLPLRMAPFILVSTVVSHLFGASVGREGTAVQMGAALSDSISKVFRLNNSDRQIILMAGMSAGFASVFGTPLAGGIFALEVLTVGTIRYQAAFPCVLAAVLANQVSSFLGIHHSHFSIPIIPEFSNWTLFALLISGLIFGWTARLFKALTHLTAQLFKNNISYSPLRPFLGGLIIVGLLAVFDAHAYIGIGSSTIAESFVKPLASYDFAGKLFFTVLSISSGFKGGEVTPLFFIGATLGNALAPFFNMPIAFLAGLGLVAVFAGASNTPIACTFMAIELFGSPIASYAALVCLVSYLFSGNSSIYLTQKINFRK